jgi:hypothetical protein
VGWLALSFFGAAAILMLATQGDYGVVSDVPNYFFSSMRQLVWLQDLTQSLLEGSPGDAINRDSVLEHWRWMPERVPHPPLSREIGGVSWLVFRDLLDTIGAYRVGVMLTFACLTGACAAFTAIAAGSLTAGAGAGLTILTIPALFAHGHFAHTDLFLSAFWFGAAACLYVWMDSPRPGLLIGAGLLLGAALATKLTGLLLVPVLGMWLLIRRPRDAAWALSILGLLAAAVFFLSNPVLWVDPKLGVADYFGAGLERVEGIGGVIRTEYFGRFFRYRGPWHYPVVWTVIVIPPTLLVAMTAGLFDGRRKGLIGFCLLNIAVLYLALLLPSAPMHDGVRLFLPAFPFFAVLAGVGTVFIVDRIGRLVRSDDRRMTPVLASLVLLLLFLPAAAAVVRTHPYQLSYFNLLIGGTAGAAEIGLEVTNLKEVLNEEVLVELSASIAADAAIDGGFFLEEVCFYQTLNRAPLSWNVETAWPARDSRGSELVLACRGDPVREPTVVNRSVQDPDFLFVLNRKAMWRRIEWALYDQEAVPFYQVALDGVPLLSVYRMR